MNTKNTKNKETIRRVEDKGWGVAYTNSWCTKNVLNGRFYSRHEIAEMNRMVGIRGFFKPTQKNGGWGRDINAAKKAAGMV